MGKGVTKWRGGIFGSVFLIVLALIGGMFAVNFQPTTSFIDKAAQPMSILSNDDWHDGTNQSTFLVDVTYTTGYSTRTAGGANNTIEGVLSQTMQLSYKDGSGTSVGFVIACAFDQGGLDISNQKVLDWSKLNHIELSLSSASTVNGTWTNTMYIFEGFNIISGNASDLNITRNYDNSTDSWYSSLNNVVASISYWNNAAKISAVTLSTENYTYQGSTLQESVASFNVTINSDIANLPLTNSAPNVVQTYVPTVLTFQVTHNATDTKYKYGASIDWSEAKAFPTMHPLRTGISSLTPGQNYSLVSQDLLSFSYSASPGGDVTQIKAFSTDANNDSAIYILDGKEMCRELLTTQYTMDGSSQVHNTTRIYVADAVQNEGGNVSSIYVVFDGFKYNQSTGMAFDPAVITPNSIASSSGSGSIGLDMVLPLMLVIVVVAIAAVVIVLRRRK